MSGPINRILFICTGNICRSPFAEGLLRRILRDKGFGGIETDSAGLFALPGNAATAMAQQVAAEHEVDLSGHRAQPVSQDLIKWCDLALVMEKTHEKDLLASYPEAQGKVLLLRHFARQGSRNRGIADPYGLQYEAYRFCFLDIYEAVTGLLEYLGGFKRTFEPVTVRCYEGYRACESPRSFSRQGRTYRIAEIVDRWYEGNQESAADAVDYFKVEVEDGKRYILRYNQMTDRWGIMVQ
jgi:protein-tyrosine-phosphatase